MKADRVLQILLDACRAQQGDTVGNALLQACNQFYVQAPQDPELLEAAARALPELPASAASWLAIALGGVAENSGTAAQSVDAVLGLFQDWVGRLPVVVEEDKVPPPRSTSNTLLRKLMAALRGVLGACLPGAAVVGGAAKPSAEQAELIGALPRLCQSVVTHLARLPATRARLQNDDALVERLAAVGHWSFGLAWVEEALRRRSGYVTLLHVPTQRGLRMRYENISTCFHLFSLLQIAIGEDLPGGRVADAEVARVARGEDYVEVRDQAWWHFGSPRCKTPELMGSIWGETSPVAIPAVNGEQIILLWPPIFQSKTWSSGFFGGHLQALPAQVVIEETLSPEVCRQWLSTLGIAVDGPGPG